MFEHDNEALKEFTMEMLEQSLEMLKEALEEAIERVDLTSERLNDIYTEIARRHENEMIASRATLKIKPANSGIVV